MRNRQPWIWLTALLIAGAWYIAPPSNAAPVLEEAPLPVSELAE